MFTGPAPKSDITIDSEDLTHASKEDMVPSDKRAVDVHGPRR